VPAMPAAVVESREIRRQLMSVVKLMGIGESFVEVA